MRLSKTQREVLRLMAEDWELGRSTGLSTRCWLQKNGIGRVGKTKDVRFTTLFALEGRGLIFGKYKYPTMKYFLTESGKFYAEQTVKQEQ